MHVYLYVYLKTDMHDNVCIYVYMYECIPAYVMHINVYVDRKMCMYVYMYLCLYIPIHAWAYAFLFVCMNVLMLTDIHGSVYIFMYECIHTYRLYAMYIGRHAWGYGCVFMCVCVWIYIYTYIYIYIYMCVCVCIYLCKVYDWAHACM